MTDKELQRVVLYAQVAAQLAQVVMAEIGRVKTLLASDGGDDAALVEAMARLDAAIARSKADAGL